MGVVVTEQQPVYEVGQVVSGHRWTGTAWEPVATYEVGQVVNGHQWTGSDWIPVPPPPPPQAPPPPPPPSPPAAVDVVDGVDDAAGVLLDSLDKKARKTAEEALEPDETVLVVIPAEYGGLVATDRRVLMIKRGATTGAMWSKQVNAWQYTQISGVEDRPQMTSRALVLQMPGATPITKYGRLDTGPNSVWQAPNGLMVEKKSALVDKGVARLRQLIADHQRPPNIAGTPAQGLSQPDVADQIRRLAELRDEGLLSEEEFQAKKLSLLGL